MIGSEHVLLDFRTLLKLLAWAFGKGEFTARDVYGRIQPYLSLIALSMPDLAPRIYSRFSMKSISNDLGRLYRMGLLKRRRVKRLVRTRSGKLCFRGYEYKYSISSQGWSYLNYLENSGKKIVDEAEDLMVQQVIEKYFPKEQQEILLDLWRLWRISTSGRRGYRRFSTTEHRLREEVLENAMKLAKEVLSKRIEELRKIIEKLMEIIEILVEKNIMLERENTELRKRILEKSVAKLSRKLNHN